ncbi:MAG: DUF4826 family protein [Woeseiaceae bacterium]|nr:DUF4826 family protein [Woeseiaceae bacterium]
MNNQTGDAARDQAMAWAKQRLDDAVIEVIDSGIFKGAAVEARPEWTLPNKIVIGRIRDFGPGKPEYWVIAGEVPTDVISADLCATPREAARHFALKWQVGADQIRDPEFRKSQGLIQDKDWEAESAELTGVAESLYQVVEADKVWG